MIVQKLKMYNFRCFSSFEIVFSNKINILLGRNATGKTSILEAINYLALTKFTCWQKIQFKKVYPLVFYL